MSKHFTLMVIALTGLMLACNQSEPEPLAEPNLKPATAAKSKPAEPQPTPPPEPPGAKPSLLASEPKTEVADTIATEEDFEQEASEVITADNLESELDRLEAEIKAD